MPGTVLTTSRLFSPLVLTKMLLKQILPDFTDEEQAHGHCGVCLMTHDRNREVGKSVPSLSELKVFILLLATILLCLFILTIQIIKKQIN